MGFFSKFITLVPAHLKNLGCVMISWFLWIWIWIPPAQGQGGFNVHVSEAAPGGCPPLKRQEVDVCALVYGEALRRALLKCSTGSFCVAAAVKILLSKLFQSEMVLATVPFHKGEFLSFPLRIRRFSECFL